MRILIIMSLCAFSFVHAMDSNTGDPISKINQLAAQDCIDSSKEYATEFKKIEDELMKPVEKLYERLPAWNPSEAYSYFAVFKTACRFFSGYFDDSDHLDFSPRKQIQKIERTVLQTIEKNHLYRHLLYQTAYVKETRHDDFAVFLEELYSPLILNLSLPGISQTKLNNLKEWDHVRNLVKPYKKSVELLCKRKMFKKAAEDYVNYIMLLNVVANQLAPIDPSQSSMAQKCQTKCLSMARIFKRHATHDFPELFDHLKIMDPLEIDQLKKKSTYEIKQKHLPQVLQLKLSGVQMVDNTNDDLKFVDELLTVDLNKTQCLLQ